MVHPRELGPVERTAWREMQAATPAFDSPFLSPEFAVAVGAVRPASRVAVLEDGGHVVGFLPFEQRPLAYAVPIAPTLNEAQAVVHVPGLEWDARDLLRRCGLVGWEFDHALEQQPQLAPFARSRKLSPVMDLTDGFASYLAERRQASTRVRDLPRRRRRLEREVGPVRFVFESSDAAALRTLMDWKSEQYRRTGRPDRFAEPWIVALVEALLGSREEGCTGRMSLLYAGDRLVAGHVGLSTRRVLPTWFPVYDPGFSRHSPGLLLHLAMAEEAAAAGVTVVDLGPGAKDYKESLKNRDAVVTEGRVVRPTPTAALHWARREPVRRLRHELVGRPALFRAADTVLRGWGRLRTGASAPHSAVPPQVR